MSQLLLSSVGTAVASSHGGFAEGEKCESQPEQKCDKSTFRTQPVEAKLECAGCSQAFSSRNALFRHLKEHGCSGGTRRRTDRALVFYGYSGTPFHGSQRNAIADEARCPTAEGALLAALELAALQQPEATAAHAEVHSRASRTDRGVHALANAVCIKLVTEFSAPKGSSGKPGRQKDAADYAPESFIGAFVQSMRSEEAPTGGGESVSSVMWHPLLDHEFDARRACQKREYWYYVPYDALMVPEERARRPSVPWTPEGWGTEEACWLWVSGLPDVCTEVEVKSRLEELLQEASHFSPTSGGVAGEPAPSFRIEQVELAQAGCTATVRFASAASAFAACAILDGAEGLILDPCLPNPDGRPSPTTATTTPTTSTTTTTTATTPTTTPATTTAGLRGRLLALPAPEASLRRAVHARLRRALSKLTGARSFHNFSPGFKDAKDPRSFRSVYRCRSGITNGFRELAAGRAFAVLKITGRDFLYRQILSMTGLVLAVVRGSVPETYMDLALGPQGDIEVPCLLPGNLVLAQCVFREGAVPEPVLQQAGLEKKGADGDGSSADPDFNNTTVLQARLVAEIARADSFAAFSEFVRELDEETAPRMHAILARSPVSRPSVASGLHAAEADLG
ncbi:unnamed protein product [Polarella glacialis]|uniref:C2H2-type domain-containing protein n=1 Tax=Polarella glacialis TaxID=89957 RepID=A0A813F1J6_POLGL|nr:unnamed protein product [Polarella glacialis]